MRAFRGDPLGSRPSVHLFAAAVTAVLLLASCGSEPNPVLGVWDVSVKTGNSSVDMAVGIFTAIQKPSVSFSENAMTLSGLGPADGARAVTYRQDKNDAWMVCFGDDPSQGQCQFFSFQDDIRSRATFNVLGLELSLVKRPGPATS
jgi:hypothetical protein